MKRLTCTIFIFLLLLFLSIWFIHWINSIQFNSPTAISSYYSWFCIESNQTESQVAHIKHDTWTKHFVRMKNYIRKYFVLIIVKLVTINWNARKTQTAKKKKKITKLLTVNDHLTSTTSIFQLINHKMLYKYFTFSSQRKSERKKNASCLKSITRKCVTNLERLRRRLNNKLVSFLFFFFLVPLWDLSRFFSDRKSA